MFYCGIFILKRLIYESETGAIWYQVNTINLISLLEEQFSFFRNSVNNK
jgi:hypothetical protein